jgi:glycolate oxidase FAD binding subunit
MSGPLAALDELEQVVGASNLLSDTDRVSEYTVEGQRPLAVAVPGSAEQVASLLRICASAKLSVLLRGAGHHLHLGSPPQPIGLLVSLARLDQVVQYDVDDLTLTAQAGVPLQQLRPLCAQHGQMLPLDHPGPATATLGGLAATDLSGALRMRYGAFRDLALGLRVALPSGEVVRTGGRTVKNVAGYDLTKLFVGSLGSLGAIVEVTLRLTPSPERRASLLVSLPLSRASDVAARVRSSPWEIAPCELLNPAAAVALGKALPVSASGDDCVLLLGLSGSDESVLRQEREARALLVEGEQAEGIEDRIRALGYPAQDAAPLLGISVPLAALPEIVELVNSNAGWKLAAHMGTGKAYVSPGGEEDLSSTMGVLGSLRAAASRLGGHAVLESGPPELKRQFPVWGDSVPNSDIMAALRAAYDPVGIMGCGRLPW